MSAPLRLVLVTGLSGAGRSSALHAFEDMGFEAIDNLPLRLLPAVLSGLDPLQPDDCEPPPLAIGIDIRTRDFAPEALAQALADLRGRFDVRAQLLFLDCDDDVLVRRFTETRRRHPLAADRPAIAGIQRERGLLSPLRDLADEVLDTSLLGPGDLKRRLGEIYAGPGQGLTLSVISFAYRHGLPREADLVFDARFLTNPHWSLELRPMSGLDAPVAAHIAQDPRFAPFLDRLGDLVASLLEAYRGEGKSYLTIAIGCTGGRHRSVLVAERLAARVADQGLRATVTHRDLNRGP